MLFFSLKNAPCMISNLVQKEKRNRLFWLVREWWALCIYMGKVFK